MAHQLHKLNPKLRKHKFTRQIPRDYNPVKWDKYFDCMEDIEVDEDKFRIYTSGTSGPVLVLLHGGGYSGLTWAVFTKEIQTRVQCRICAIDLRGHGNTFTTDDDNLSMEQIFSDVSEIIKKKYEDEPIVLIGHSMGGAFAVHCAASLENTVTLCVIDVVEGTALESLSSMQSFLRGRPSSFQSTQTAIEWCLKSGQTQNLDAAKVSMPGQIKNKTTGKLAADEIDEISFTNYSASAPVFKIPTLGVPTVDEEEEEEGSGEIAGVGSSASVEAVKPPPCTYIWRINLSKTEPYWRGWFNGLSQSFLNVSVPKLLLLANIHGLDTALTVGQMQGKFQMQVLPRCGHAIHEDLPDKVAEIIATFLVRHKLTNALGDFVPMPPMC